MRARSLSPMPTGGSCLRSATSNGRCFPRSAVKAMQAMPLVESGAADAFGLGEDELAVACASHSGESAHVEAVRSLLAKAGLDESYLACGAHWPISEEAVARADTRRAPPASHPQ